MKKIENIGYIINRLGENDGSIDHMLDMYLPDGDSFPAFVYFHGGGLKAGDKKGHAFIGNWFAEHGIAFIAANYRMYPNASYPDFIKDAAAAVAWVKKHISEYGGDGRVYVGGSSAGGYLSMMLCFDKKYLSLHNIKPEEISGYIHDAGQPTTHFNVLHERGVDSRRVIIDEAAPIYHIGCAEKYAPMIFFVADSDMKNRYEQTVLTVSTLKHFGYDMTTVELKLMENCTHTSYTSAADANGDSVFGKLVSEFINKH